MRSTLITATLAALTLTGPAMAAGKDFAPPEGCESFLTVQSKECSVALLWRCDVAPEGDVWEATFSAGGLQSVVSYSRDYQWLDSVYLWDSSREEFAPPAQDPIDLSELLASGIDTYDFIMRRSEPGGSRDVRMVGADQLTGQMTMIDGWELERVDTQLQILAEDGSVEYHSQGVQYLSRDLRTFFLGPDQVFGTDGSVSEFDGSPIDIILPGEPGFGATTPLYDCEQQDAGFVPGAPMTGQKETTDDEI